MAGAVSRFKSIMNEKVVSFCLLGVLFWMPDIYIYIYIYAFLICRIWPSSECSKQKNLFLLPVNDYIYIGTYVCMYVRRYVGAYRYACRHVCPSVFVYNMYVGMYGKKSRTYVCMYVCMYGCMQACRVCTSY